jgi:hypothetical protein
MGQNNLPEPFDPAPESGTALASHLDLWRDALHSLHAGSSPPAYLVQYMLWLDTTSATAAILKLYTGTVHIPIARFDITNGQLKQRADEVSIASAATTDILGQATDFVTVTGTTGITSFGTPGAARANMLKYVRFQGILTVTHNGTTLILPNNGSNMTTAAGDVWTVVSDNSGNARVINVEKAGGPPAATIASGTKMVFQQTSAPSGWTKDTTHNDKAFRVVSGAASSGGTVAFSTCFSRTASDGTAITQAQLPVVDFTVTGSAASAGLHSHDNTADANNGSINVASGNQTSVADSGGTNNTSSDGSHTHSVSGTAASGGSGSTHTHGMDIRVQYVDVIIATKD